MAKSRAGSLPPTACRIDAKLLSMPYQPSSDGFISCHPPASPPPTPCYTSPPPTTCALCSVHPGLLALLWAHCVLPYLCPLPTHVIPYVCNVLPCFCAQEGPVGPRKPCSRGISTVKAFWPVG